MWVFSRRRPFLLENDDGLSLAGQYAGHDCNRSNLDYQILGSNIMVLNGWAAHKRLLSAAANNCRSSTREGFTTEAEFQPSYHCTEILSLCAADDGRYVTYWKVLWSRRVCQTRRVSWQATAGWARRRCRPPEWSASSQRAVLIGQ